MKSSIVLSILNDNYFFLPLIFLCMHIVNVMLDEIIKKKNKFSKNDEKPSKKEKKYDTLAIICFLIIVFSILYLFLSIKILKIIFMIVNTSYLVYILIISPLLNIKLTYSFKNDSTMISSFLFTEIFCFSIISKYDPLINFIGNGIMSQVAVIIFLTIKLLLISYFILLNIYNIIRNLNILVMDNLNLKTKNEIEKIDAQYNIEHLDNLINSKRNLLIKIFIFLIKSIQWVLMVLFIRGFLFSISTIYEFISKLFINDSNSTFYSLSKISLIFSLFITYCIVTLTNDFSASIISIFELIISTLIIPIILEIMLSNKRKNY